MGDLLEEVNILAKGKSINKTCPYETPKLKIEVFRKDDIISTSVGDIAGDNSFSDDFNFGE